MIEDNIKTLRRIARVTSNNDNPQEEEKIWCVIAGNVEFIDDVAYKAISSNHLVKILFREHAILKENKVNKKFDFIMLYGVIEKIDEFGLFCKENGGAFIRISPIYLKEEKNLMVFVAPDNIIKHTVKEIEKAKIPFAILLESQTNRYIDVELDSSIKLPNFIKSALKPIYSASDVVLTTVLISVENDEDIFKLQSIATSNKIFVIDFKDFKMEANQ